MIIENKKSSRSIEMSIELKVMREPNNLQNTWISFTETQKSNGKHFF